MDTICIEELDEENQDASTEVGDIIEGLQDDLRLDISSESRGFVSGLLARFQSRSDLHKEVEQVGLRYKQAIEALIADGYPEIPFVDVPDSVLDDLDEQTRTRAASRRQFRKMPMTSVGVVTVGEQTPIE